MRKTISRIKWHLKELNKTLSNQESFYSSKRLERMLLFINAMILLDLFVIKQYHKLTTSEIVAFFTAQMLYAGFTTTQIFKDKPKDDASAL